MRDGGLVYWPRNFVAAHSGRKKESPMSNSNDYYTEKTIASWDEVAPKHESINASLRIDVKDKNFNSLNPDFNELVESLGVHNKSVVQICCNNAIDLLSIKNKGAGRCLGIDGSSKFIDQAIMLSQCAGHTDIEYACSDIYKIPEKYQSSFDVAVITVGVFGWMPDIHQFMEVCSSLLVPGGQFLVEELHPVLLMYEEGNPSFINYSYFETEPVVDNNGLDYFTHEKYKAKENYSFQHTLAEILMSAMDSNLELAHIKELKYNVANYCADLEFHVNNPPLGINLGWRKKGQL